MHYKKFEEDTMLSTWEALFPTPVLRTNIGREFTQQELAFFTTSQSSTTGNVLNRRTVDTHVLDAGELASLRLFIEDHIRQFARKTISISNALEFYITQSWINYTKPGEAHHRHHHTNSIISGVFYISALREVDGICFYRNAPSTLRASDEQQNCYTANSWRFEVGAGDLILFPSSMTHGVDCNNAAHVRISLAFNTFLRGELGSERLLNHLTI